MQSQIGLKDVHFLWCSIIITEMEDRKKLYIVAPLAWPWAVLFFLSSLKYMYVRRKIIVVLQSGDEVHLGWLQISLAISGLLIILRGTVGQCSWSSTWWVSWVVNKILVCSYMIISRLLVEHYGIMKLKIQMRCLFVVVPSSLTLARRMGDGMFFLFPPSMAQKRS